MIIVIITSIYHSASSIIETQIVETEKFPGGTVVDHLPMQED